MHVLVTLHVPLRLTDTSRFGHDTYHVRLMLRKLSLPAESEMSSESSQTSVLRRLDTQMGIA